MNDDDEEEVVDEEEEEEEYGRQAIGESSCAVSQDLFLTPRQSSQSSTGEPDAGEGTLGHLSQIRRRKKSALLDPEHRAWRMNTVDNLEKKRVERRKAQESQLEKERKMHQDIMGLLRWGSGPLQQLQEVGHSTATPSTLSLQTAAMLLGMPSTSSDAHYAGKAGGYVYTTAYVGIIYGINYIDISASVDSGLSVGELLLLT
ncbi:hypothetical protein UY3_14067 [Chelonia mydas]|uniref:Uncharacterized protein n=1 Tax=Chelonia mydas TaxID=8469 RepID=M7BKW8_CHEMY|nr:hypothetical protein UY3_14067 [Chelonia mydas]